ncbi:hypothetical protein HYV80_01345 [Candidatus Woesearchaeota archaeon]|nr:hypothetical protein [Candidatus Woesearchaeota archaeon]
MKKVKIFLILFAFLAMAIGVLAAQTGSGSYKQNVIVSEGGENLSSASYKQNIALDIINGIINSASYINKLGFFHLLLLADGQPCTSASQCEGGFCCSSSCRSSSCPVAAAAGGDGAAAGGGGGGAVLPEEEVKDFSVAPSSIKEHLILGETKQNQITIQNTGNTALEFDLNVLTVSSFVSLQESSFSLMPGEERNVLIEITGAKLGSYIGEIEVAAGDIKKSVDIIIEVVSEQVLFDVKIDIPSAYHEVEPGAILKAQVTLFNVGPGKRVDVTPTYIIKDKLGNVIYEYTETFAVEQQKSYAYSFRIPKTAQPGDYLAIVELRYEKSFAVSSQLFKVVSKKGLELKQLLKSNTIVIIWAALIASVFLLVYLFEPKIKMIESGKIRRFNQIINAAQKTFGSNDSESAKKLYLEARKIYMGMKPNEKKIAYIKLNILYSKLKSRLK